MWPVFLNFAPMISSELVKLGTSNVDWYTEVLAHAWYDPRKRCVVSRDLFKFWEIGDNNYLVNGAK